MVDIRATTDVSIKDDNTGTYVDVAGTATDAKGLDTLPLGRYISSAPTLTNGQVHPLRLTPDAKLMVDATTKPSTASQNNILYTAATVGKNGGSVTYDYVIPNGKTYTGESFAAGGYLKANATISLGKAEVFYGVPAANEVGMTLYKIIYLGPETVWIPFTQAFAGDGTKVIRMKFTNISSVDTSMSGEIVGYEV
jgi:hypothetical protein